MCQFPGPGIVHVDSGTAYPQFPPVAERLRNGGGVNRFPLKSMCVFPLTAERLCSHSGTALATRRYAEILFLPDAGELRNSDIWLIFKIKYGGSYFPALHLENTAQSSFPSTPLDGN